MSAQVCITEGLLFADRAFDAGSDGLFIRENEREGLDASDIEWIELRQKKAAELLRKQKSQDVEEAALAKDQLKAIRAESLVILGGKLRAIPNHCLSRQNKAPEKPAV